jgi:hypothetical protein
MGLYRVPHLQAPLGGFKPRQRGWVPLDLNEHSSGWGLRSSVSHLPLALFEIVSVDGIIGLELVERSSGDQDHVYDE